MEFVKASMKYLEQMCEITDQAKRQLAGLGLDQWQKGYPSREVWLSDIEEGCTYLAVDEEKVLGIFAFQTTPDPSYGEIEGKWLTDGPYASMHRVCVADGCKGKGVAGQMFRKGFALAEELAAVRLLPCGNIRLVGGTEDGDPRIAFEKVL